MSKNRVLLSSIMRRIKKRLLNDMNLWHRIIYRSPAAYINSFFEKYKNRLDEKIGCILKYDKKDIGLSSEEQEEQALPGSKKWFETGWYKYMLSRYLYSIKHIKNKIVLDSGCGLGWGSYLISDYPKELTSIDINEKALNFAREKWKDRRLDFRKHSVLDLDSLDKKFDVILGLELIEHLTLNEGGKYLKQAFNNLTKKGVLILSSSFPDSEEEAKLEEQRNIYHLKIFTKDEIERFARKASFRKIEFIGSFMMVIKK